MTTDWTYYAITEPPEYPVGDPKGLARRRPGAAELDAQELQFTDGTWRPSDVVVLAFLGHDEEVEPVTEARARELVRAWHREGSLRRLPDGLDGPGGRA